MAQQFVSQSTQLKQVFVYIQKHKPWIPYDSETASHLINVTLQSKNEGTTRVQSPWGREPYLLPITNTLSAQ